MKNGNLATVVTFLLFNWEHFGLLAHNYAKWDPSVKETGTQKASFYYIQGKNLKTVKTTSCFVLFFNDWGKPKENTFRKHSGDKQTQSAVQEDLRRLSGGVFLSKTSTTATADKRYV